MLKDGGNHARGEGGGADKGWWLTRCSMPVLPTKVSSKLHRSNIGSIYSNEIIPNESIWIKNPKVPRHSKSSLRLLWSFLNESHSLVAFVIIVCLEF